MVSPHLANIIPHLATKIKCYLRFMTACKRTTPWQAGMKYYYILLQSENDSERFYTGFTDDLESHLRAHNQGKCVHTSNFVP